MKGLMRLLWLTSLLTVSAASGQSTPDPATLMELQRAAMAKLSIIDGMWRGQSATTLANGKIETNKVTMRAGPRISGTIRIFEERSFDSKGKLVDSELWVLSYDPASKSYKANVWARGSMMEYVLLVSGSGFAIKRPKGTATRRFTDTIKGRTWREVGELIEAGKPTVRNFEMTLERISDVAWP